MKKLTLLNLLSFVFLFLCPVQKSAPESVPVGKEPRHQVKFENPFVRVIDASVAVGDATLFHTHDLDNVPVNVSGGKLKTETVGQAEPVFSTIETGRTSFAKGGYTHRITNTGDTPLRFIDVEILSPYARALNSPTAVATLDKVAGYTLILENERVRVYRIIIDAGQVVPEHSHALPRLSVAVNAGKLAIETNHRKPKTKTFQVGDFDWHQPENRHQMKNLGAEKFELVEIEWK